MFIFDVLNVVKVWEWFEKATCGYAFPPAGTPFLHSPHIGGYAFSPLPLTSLGDAHCDPQVAPKQPKC